MKNQKSSPTLLDNLFCTNKARQKIIGCFPLYPPNELFFATGFVPVTLWNLKRENNDLSESDRHIQNYSCSVSRFLLQFILNGGFKYFDAFFFYNACDTLRNLPEILKQALREKNVDIPMFNIHLPAGGPEQTFANQYLQKQINNLTASLEKAGNDFSPALFGESSHLLNKIRNILIELESLVSEGKMTYSLFSEIIAAGNFIKPEDHYVELRKNFSAFADKKGNCLPGIIISGILPPCPQVIKIIENAGLRVAGNDVASQRRSYGYIPSVSENPAAYYIDFYNNHQPCPTLHYTSDRREENLLKYIKKTEAKGIIFIGEKFCEYEYFEFPFIEKVLRKKGIHCLNLEFSAEDSGDFSAIQTRVEAFAELLYK